MSHAQISGVPNNSVDASSAATGGYKTGRRMSSAHIKLNFFGCIRSEILKLISLASTWWLMGITIVLFPAMSALTVFSLKVTANIDLQTGKTLAKAQPLTWSELWYQNASLITNIAIVVGIFGVMAMTTEFTTGSVQSSLTSNPRRLVFANAKAMAVTLFTFIASMLGILLAYLVCVLMTLGQKITPLPNSKAYVPIVIVVAASLVLALTSLLALGLGAICRSTAGGVCAFLGLFILLPSLTAIVSGIAQHEDWLSSIMACLPSTAMANFSTAGINATDQPTSGVHVTSSSLDTAIGFVPTWWQSGLIFLAWTAFFYAIGILVFKHKDIS